ncbi:MAG: prepilin peptidase [Acetobacteraceae bacterium]
MPVWVWPTILAPFVGSFLGVVIRRLPAGGPLVMARSRCEICGRAIAPWDMVPLASYIWLRGRCRACHGRIAPSHLIIELAAIGVPLSTAWVGIGAPRLWVGCGLGWALLALGWIDWEHFRLPDSLTLPLLLAGLGVTWWLAPGALVAHVIGVVAGYVGLRLLNAAYRLLRGRDGVGRGDAKLLAASGAWLGPAALPAVLWLAAIAGLAIAGVLWWRGKPVRRATPMPFGTCLALATWLVWISAPYLLQIMAL